MKNTKSDLNVFDDLVLARMVDNERRSLRDVMQDNGYYLVFNANANKPWGDGGKAYIAI